ncbi:MAG: hypothetical protein ACJ8EH_13420 [Sphingomicrobium sp.]|jgi:hypothetical protein
MLVTLLSLAATTAVPVEVGRFDPARFPNAKKVERRIPHAELVRRVDHIIADKQCTIAGANKAQYDIVVPYAVRMEPDGSASKVVVKDLGCAPIETLVGQVANELIRAGDFRPSHEDGERWYVSEVYFAHGGETLARETGDPDRVICEEPRTQIGSRIAQTKVCRTAEEWRIYDADRDQAKRDLLHRGMVPGGR